MKLRSVRWLILALLAVAIGFALSIGAGRLRRHDAREETPRIVHSDETSIESPRIVYPTQFDLGVHELGEQVRVPFTIANRGGQVLFVKHISSNCSCLGMEREQDGQSTRLESLELAPGTKTDLVMRVSVRGVPPGSRMTSFIDFETNDPAHPACHMDAIVSQVTAGVSGSPEEFYFGSVAVGAKVQQKIEIRDSAVQPRRVAKIWTTSPDKIAIRWRSIPPDQGRQNSARGCLIGEVDVSVATDKPAEFDDKIQVELADADRKPDAIRVVGKIVRPVQVLPSSLLLPRASASGPIYSADCIVRAVEGGNLAIEVGPLPVGLSATVIEKGQAATQVIRISWQPSAKKPLKPREPLVVRLVGKTGTQKVQLELPVFISE